MSNNDKKLTPDEVIESAKALGGQTIVMHDLHWRYPHRGDDTNTCKMLDIMLQTEYRSGTFIFIPDLVNVGPNMPDRNKD